jgi:dTDP-4-dehydrorhamnose reductase
MRALVIGASGQVGAALQARLAARGHSVIGTYHSVPQPGMRPLDVGDPVAVERTITEVEPTWVFCPAGLTTVDFCEDQPGEAFRANRDGPAAAARAATRCGAGFVYFSTEYVFDGAAGPYSEDDPPRPLSVYGRSKLEGERAAQEANPRTLVIRSTVVYGPEPQGKNFIYQLLRRARAGQPITVPADQRSSPTYNRDLAAATVEATERALTGVLHLAGPVVLDRHAFTLTACEVFGLDPGRVTPVTTEALGQRAARPLNAGLKIERAQSWLTTRFRGPKEGLAAMREALEAASG